MSTNGTITRLSVEKGFGFIMAADGTEYFFHRSACAQTEFEATRAPGVTFDISDGAKGPPAGG